MKNIIITLLIALFVSGCSTLKIDVDHDSSFAFNTKRTYAVVHNVREGDNTLVNDRIDSAIKSYLNKEGYTEVSKEKADLIFVFHVNVMNRSDIRTDYQMIGYPGYRYGFGYGGYGYGYAPGTTMIATPSTYRWKEGKLVIDALNPLNKKIVWRGTVSDELTRKSTTTQEKTEYINSIVTKVMKKFPTK
jgi:hypothetical protein